MNYIIDDNMSRGAERTRTFSFSNLPLDNVYAGKVIRDEYVSLVKCTLNK